MRLDDIVWRSKNHNYHGKVFQNKSTFDSEAKKDSEVYKHEKNILDLNKINSTYSWYLRWPGAEGAPGEVLEQAWSPGGKTNMDLLQVSHTWRKWQLHLSPAQEE